MTYYCCCYNDNNNVDTAMLSYMIRPDGSNYDGVIQNVCYAHYAFRH